MEWISLFTNWVLGSPLERLLLCAETSVIVIGGPLAWWHRWTLKSRVRDLQCDLSDMRRKQDDDMAGMNRKQDDLLSMMRKMVGQPEVKQKQIPGGRYDACSGDGGDSFRE